LCRQLRADGFDPWLDQEKLLPGQSWQEEIPIALNSSDAVIVCISRTSVNKAGYVQKEIRIALDAADEQPEGAIFIIPVKLEECEVPRRLSRWQWVNLYDAHGYARLVSALRERAASLGRLAPSERRLETSASIVGIIQPSWIRRNALVLAAAGLVVAVGLGVMAWRTLWHNQRRATSSQTSAAPPGMLMIPGDTFLMGRDDAIDPEETPAHHTTVSTFFIDRDLVTNARYWEYAAIHHQERGGPTQRTGQADAPVTGVTWLEARAYCMSRGGRLPTEAEWEFAARGPDGRLYPWGTDFRPGLVNSIEADLRRVEAVGTRANASPFGVRDMSGNVWQWCEDDYRTYPPRATSSPIPAGAKAIRGGSFQSDKDHVTSTARNFELGTRNSPLIGFRCAKSP
jgi:formylglycine-generating enzyme required for sulfatase activity